MKKFDFPKIFRSIMAPSGNYLFAAIDLVSAAGCKQTITKNNYKK